LQLVKSKEFIADILLLCVAISWGVTFLMVQDVTKDVPVYAFLFYRFFLAAILMFIVAYRYKSYFNIKTFYCGILLGAVLFFSYATQTFGLVYTKSSIVAFITGLYVVFVPILLFLFYKQKIRIMVAIGSSLAIIGLYFLTNGDSFSLGKGEFFTILCAVGFALHIIYTGIFSKKCNVFLLVFIQLFTVSILSLIFSLLLEAVTFNIEFNNAFYKAVIITSIVATFLAFLIQTYMQKFTTPTKTAIIFSIEPVSAAFYSYFTIGEILSPIQIFGAGLILIAMLLIEIKLKQKNK
jgi:drug/metabolite transporter (DMT)-like permease